MFLSRCGGSSGIMQEYSRTTCSKANAHNPALLYSADRCSTRPLTRSRSLQRQPHHWQAAHPNISSKAHENLLAKTITQTKISRVQVKLRKASQRKGAFVRKLSILKLFNLKLLVPGIRIRRNFARPSYPESFASRCQWCC